MVKPSFARGVVAGAVLVLLSAAGCGGPPDYLPLTVGAEWTYRWTYHGEQGHHVMRVVSRTHEGYRVEGAEPLLDSDELVLRSGPDGVRMQMLGLEIDLGLDEFFILRYPLEPGDTWNHGEDREEEVRIRFRCDARETVTVPAGTFACVRIVIEMIRFAGDTPWEVLPAEAIVPTVRWWFAPGVGLVKSGDGVGVGHGTTLYELEAYR